MDFKDLIIDFKDLMMLIVGGIIGVIASSISTLLFIYLNNRKNLPIIKISPNLIKSTNNEEKPSLTIKLINKTKEDVADIIIEVKKFKNTSPKGSIPLLNFVTLTRQELLYITKFDKKDTSHHYAHQIQLHTKEGEDIIKLSDGEDLRVSIKVSCPYYNTFTVLSQTYSKENILDDSHRFNTGESLSAQQ